MTRLRACPPIKRYCRWCKGEMRPGKRGAIGQYCDRVCYKRWRRHVGKDK